MFQFHVFPFEVNILKNCLNKQQDTKGPHCLPYQQWTLLIKVAL